MKFVATNATVTDDQPATEKILPRKHGTIPRKIRRGVGYFGLILARVCMPLLPCRPCVSFSGPIFCFGSSSRNVGVLTSTKAAEVKTQDIFRNSFINC